MGAAIPPADSVGTSRPGGVREAGRAARLAGSAGMGRTGLILIGAACVAAASCALADELPASGSESAGQGKSKILKPTKPNSAGPTKIPFSNPYAPPSAPARAQAQS